MKTTYIIYRDRELTPDTTTEKSNTIREYFCGVGGGLQNYSVLFTQNLRDAFGYKDRNYAERMMNFQKLTDCKIFALQAATN